jgi:hypothetical protein
VRARLLLVVVTLVAAAGQASAAPPEGCCSLTASDSGDRFAIDRGQVVQVRLLAGAGLKLTTPRGTNTRVARGAIDRRGGLVTASFVARPAGAVDL